MARLEGRCLPYDDGCCAWLHIPVRPCGLVARRMVPETSKKYFPEVRVARGWGWGGTPRVIGW